MAYHLERIGVIRAGRGPAVSRSRNKIPDRSRLHLFAWSSRCRSKIPHQPLRRLDHVLRTLPRNSQSSMTHQRGLVTAPCGPD